MDSVNCAIKAAELPLTEDQIFTLQGIINDDILVEVARKSGINLDAAETMIDLFIDDFFGKGKDK